LVLFHIHCLTRENAHTAQEGLSDHLQNPPGDLPPLGSPSHIPDPPTSSNPIPANTSDSTLSNCGKRKAVDDGEKPQKRHAESGQHPDITYLLRHYLSILRQNLVENKVELTKPIEDQIKMFRITLGFVGSERGGTLSKYHLRKLEELLPHNKDVKEIVGLLQTCIEHAPDYVAVE